ncbi:MULTISPECIES: sugar ABC transporter substrate-binding protein [unclassified Oceanispirochaeta]|uniref:sugar ABC transporter substrate-binding protein n=1 Tax=unclassified Oceanispirochaeta TaxID=2635722 RepID=UPI000E09C386|nr:MULTISPECIES: sugar ABC transporter substrate-binding protein [unclassified Oceanispirochaeta]MBF9015994.1 sugar ABC transporter substrate-binding protein [Oceanispirochaeta sp. M2]NPD72457.1 sugar ABC transporter substrate-binding protein [Oceanispirochaeta sp. M1]RDG31916.1 sugar ABC transporter substrate-binding protein [Oceanispirochaeta sp. M1]
MRRIVLFLIAAVFTLTSFNLTAEGQKDDGQLKIVYSQIDLVNPFFIARMEGAKAKAEELGIKLIVDDSQCNVAKQVSSIENYIAQGVDGIVMITVDVTAMTDVVRQATEAGIPVISVITLVEGSSAKCILDEYEYGFQAGINAGEWVKEELGGAADCAILGYPEMPQNKYRIDGMKAGLLSIAPAANIVSDNQSANNTADGMKCTEILLQANKELEVIICHSDAVALGALEAVMAADRGSERFFIGGIDATPPALDKMKEKGIFRATVDMMPFAEAGNDIEMMVKLINGEEVEDHNIDFERVTWKNLDEYLSTK